MVRALVVLAVMLAAAPAAHAQNRALIVLDASDSMNEDAGAGGTRMDAAKQAVAELVDKLPPDAPIGLRVYGAKVAGTTRAAACRDTELVVPVGPLDKQAMLDTVNALEGKGRTPIGRSLLAAPDDLGPDPGRRGVVLVSDGGDNCAPPDPCKAAERVARRGLDLSISVVGLQVTERVRRQLECIARVGGGTYSDVRDAGKLGEELAALLARAFRDFEPAGTAVTGATDESAAPALGAGLFHDTLPVDEERWYGLEVPEGRRAIVTVTAVPPHDSRGVGGLRTTLRDPDGQQAAFDAFIIEGGLVPGRFGKTLSQSLRTETGDSPGRYALSVEIRNSNGLTGAELPVEIGVQYLAPGEEVGLTREAGALATPTPTPSPTPTPTPSPEPASGPPPGEEGTSWGAVFGFGLAGLAAGAGAAAVLGRRRGR